MATVSETFNFDEEVKIHKIDLKCFWNWNTHNDKCPICRNYIFESSINTENANSNKSVIGVCGHSFHHDCISNWLKTRNVCPLCNCKWEYMKKS